MRERRKTKEEEKGEDVVSKSTTTKGTLLSPSLLPSLPPFHKKEILEGSGASS